MLERFLNELRHRRVLRTAAAYALVAAAAVEFTDIVTPALELPAGLLSGVIVIALVGFPIIMILAWFFDLTPGSVVLGTASPVPATNHRSHVISISLIGLLGIAVVYLSYRLYWETQPEFERGKSIAVLPFSSTTAETGSETAYFSEGISEEILNALSKVDGLRVAARTSSFVFREHDVREVGEALNVSVVLEGTVRQAEDQLRVSARLVDTSDGFQLWSDVYNYEHRDVFRIQEEIAHAIVKELRVELLGETGTPLVSPGTSSSHAYEKYLEGRNVLETRTPSNARHAIVLFEEALKLDPDYAQAYAGLADSWIVLRDVGNLTLLEATQRSHDAISKALQLNNSLPEAQASLGLCILGGGENVGAARQFEKAIELDPEYSEGYLLRANLLRDQGFLTEATRVYSQAQSLDPLNASILENQALLFAYEGRFDEALEQLAISEEHHPGRLTASLVASRVWVLAGDDNKALSHAKRASEISPESPVALAAIVVTSLRLGNTEQARTAWMRMRELAPNNETAITATMRYYLMTGNLDELNQLATSRIDGFLDDAGFNGTELLFGRAGWAATARLALDDPQGARKILEKGFPNLDGLDPRPGNVRTLALLARARSLDSDSQGAAEVVTIAERLAERARVQGWGGSQIDDALACVAASTDSTAVAFDTGCY